MTFSEILKEKMAQHKDNQDVVKVLDDISETYDNQFSVKPLEDYWDAFKTPQELRVRLCDM